jgi:gas vesicle protein
MTGKGFIKGITTGLIVGTAVTMLADPITDRQRHRIKKKTNGMFKTIGGAIDSAMNMMR